MNAYWTHTVQILVMVVIAFALGLWLGYLLWGKWRAKYEQIKSSQSTFQAEYADVMLRNKALVNENSDLRERLTSCEKARGISAAPVVPDDLKKIEGIGPKIEKLCNAIGIYTWRQLSQTSTDRLAKMLADAGADYRTAVPGTWPRQAELAADGKWDQLKQYQDELKGGRPPELS